MGHSIGKVYGTHGPSGDMAWKQRFCAPLVILLVSTYLSRCVSASVSNSGGLARLGKVP